MLTYLFTYYPLPLIGKYFNSFFITVVVVILISIFIVLLNNVFFIIVNSCVRNKVYVLTFFTYLLTYFACNLAVGYHI